MIYLTGDTHIPIDIDKLNTRNFPEQKKMTRCDYVIVLGDFGLFWHKNREHEYWKKWLEDKPFTLLWLDGNHENHPWINSFPVSEWNGGLVHQTSENIIHLMRGQIYSINGKTFFVCGGAASYDKECRKAGISWWPEEDISYEECSTAKENLDRYNWNVDYVLTHTCPQEIIELMFGVQPITCPTSIFLNQLYLNLDFGEWYFGHWHEDKDMGKFHCLCDDVRKIM